MRLSREIETPFNSLNGHLIEKLLLRQIFILKKHLTYLYTYIYIFI